MRLHSSLSETAGPAGPALARAGLGKRKGWAQVGKGIAAFVAGCTIGASTIIIAELVTPPSGSAPSYEQGPLDLRR